MIGGIKQSLSMSNQKSHKGIARSRVHARYRDEDLFCWRELTSVQKRSWLSVNNWLSAYLHRRLYSYRHCVSAYSLRRICVKAMTKWQRAACLGWHKSTQISTQLPAKWAHMQHCCTQKSQKSDQNLTFCPPPVFIFGHFPPGAVTRNLGV
jgi:hypothetical protein